MLVFRPVQPADIAKLYAISLQTGHEGGDATDLYEDGRLVGHIYSAPYALLEPNLALVVEDDGEVAGFAVGAADTEAWFDRLEREWWPKLREVYPNPGAVILPDWSPDQRRAFMIHHPPRTPREVSEPYPAHLHLNLAPRLQGYGVGAKLLSEWIRRTSEHGVRAIHVGVNSANLRAIAFWAGQDFRLLSNSTTAPASTLWMGRP